MTISIEQAKAKLFKNLIQSHDNLMDSYLKQYLRSDSFELINPEQEVSEQDRYKATVIFNLLLQVLYVNERSLHYMDYSMNPESVYDTIFDFADFDDFLSEIDMLLGQSTLIELSESEFKSINSLLAPFKITDFTSVTNYIDTNKNKYYIETSIHHNQTLDEFLSDQNSQNIFAQDFFGCNLPTDNSNNLDKIVAKNLNKIESL